MKPYGTRIKEVCLILNKEQLDTVVQEIAVEYQKSNCDVRSDIMSARKAYHDQCEYMAFNN